MYRWLVVVAAFAACKKQTVEERIKAAEAAEYENKTPTFCALAKDIDHDKARPVLMRQLAVEADGNPLPGAQYGNERVKCIVGAIAKSKSPPSEPAAYTKLHYKMQLPELKSLYDAIPAEQKKVATLDAFGELGADWQKWHNSAATAAPMMIGELDKLGAAEDPRFMRGVVGAALLYDEVSPVVKERYAKVAQDPRAAQAFKDILVIATENKHHDAWMTYMNFLEHGMTEIVARNVTFEKDNEARALLRACAHPRGREFCEPHLGKLDAASKNALRAAVEKTTPDDHWATGARELVSMIGGGKPEDIPKILEGLSVAQQNQDRRDRDRGKHSDDWIYKGKERSPITRADPELPAFARAADALAGIGPAAIPQLMEKWQKSPALIEHRVAAHALAKIDPGAFAKQAVVVVDAYNKDLVTFRTSTLTYGNGPIAAAALIALAEAPGAEVDAAYFRALSSYDPAFSGYATRAIKKRLERDKAIDALFAFMAAKHKYAKHEIDVYTNLVTEYGAEATPAVVKNLEAMLAAAGGLPGNVFWAHKVVAMKSLQKIGTSAARNVVAKYVNDPGGYDDTKTLLDKDGNPTQKVERTPVAFKDLANQTLSSLR